ncbi:cupin domain-containing protein [Paenibacillus sp. NPDC056579]|uniref:cupin domain-containing protein n=1 Tax=Paenibacillus sp. NPDC056579 TaxID=3345871 RepID=UPI0036C9EF65
MNKTDFIDNKSQTYETRQNCHGGKGPFQLKDLIQAVSSSDKQYIKFIHDDIIPPGSTFGYHQHKSDAPVEEWYYCISGQGIMELDGKQYEMSAGDISVCRANGSHGLINNGPEDLRIIVIYASSIQ